ncbi:GNAT family N-acetyltransferase [Pseudomonas paraeruginosa]|uniref:GNAT family N-acetyltransferase n=1 Tax=Pseudomonas paraeruginosa TaxID=2994495 RepID=UPI0039FC1F33
MTDKTAAHLIIRRACPDDAIAFARIMGEAPVMQHLLGLPYPDADIWRARLSASGNPNQYDLRLVGEIDNEVVATAGLMPAHPGVRQRHVGTFGLSVATAAQGKGVGRAMLKTLIDYADNWAQLLRLELVVAADNEPAIALYKKHGFVLEGKHQAAIFTDGEYVDLLSMARIRRRCVER